MLSCSLARAVDRRRRHAEGNRGDNTGVRCGDTDGIDFGEISPNFCKDKRIHPKLTIIEIVAGVLS